MTLFHFSEDPSIRLFAPHVARTSAIQNDALVWAIDDWHAPMYYTPRECPRACFWASEQTTPEDRERWLHGLDPRFVMAVESGWLERIRRTSLYRYVLPDATFAPMGHPGGHYVSQESIRPLGIEPVGDLLDAIAAAGVELRIVSRLGPMWRRIWRQSTLVYSGTRLRNAVGHPEEFE